VLRCEYVATTTTTTTTTTTSTVTTTTTSTTANVSLQELVQRLCHMAVDFESELMQWTDDQYYSAYVHKIQLPFNQVPICTLFHLQKFVDKFWLV